MPEPRKGQSFADFMGTFMKSHEAEESFPKRRQRVAVAISLARRKKLKGAPKKPEANA